MEDTKTIATDELLMEQLTNRNWSDFWIRLMGRCAWLLRKRYGVKWPNSELQDFSRNAISETIDKIFVSKKRKWNLDSYPEFEKFIVSALDSHVNNTLNKKSSEVEAGENDYLLDNNNEIELSQADIIISNELRKEIFDELSKAGADDDELMVFDCLVEGIDKPEDIRTELGLTEENFHNIWRRLKRKRDVIQKKLAANGY
ncbi:MAG TPA: hypothetical protein VGF30_08950 [Bacteroidia bacterium]